MIDLKIKITGLSVYDEETPLELGLEDARRLWEELGKVFGAAKILYSNGSDEPKNWGGQINNYEIKIDPENMISIDEVDL